MIKSIKRSLYNILGEKRRNYLHSLSQRDILFAWIPKSAGTSIFSLLQENGGNKYYSIREIEQGFPNRGITTFGHLKLLDLVQKKIISEKYFHSAYKFSFVRNPYDRTVSIYFYYKTIGRIHEHLEFKKFCEQILKNEFPPCGLFNDEGLSHCNPQTSYIFRDDDTPIVDYIGKFESLETDLEVLSAKLALTYTPLKKLNTSSHDEFGAYYDDESVEMIKAAYERDFRLLDYDSDFSNYRRKHTGTSFA